MKHKTMYKVAMVRIKFYAAALLALALAGCNNDGPDNPLADGPVPLSFTADISSVATRATTDGFENGDVVGIFPLKENVVETAQANIAYTYDGSEFTATSPYYFQDYEEVTFNAYYPFTGTVGTSAGIITKTTDAEAQKNLPAIDFLFAEGAKANKANPVVYFTDKRKDNGKDNSFHHCMSQITIEFTEGNDITFADGRLQSYTLKGLVLEGTFNTETGEAKTTDGKQAADLKIDIENSTGDNGVFTAAPVILFPQTPAFAKEGTPVAGKIGLEVTVEGETYRATLTIPDGKTALETGCRYTFPVTVKKTGLSVGTAEITDWDSITGSGTDATL